MKTTLHSSCALLAGAIILLSASFADARCYGVSRASYSHEGAWGAPRSAAVAGVAVGAAVANTNNAVYVAPDGPTQTGQTAPPPRVSPANVPADVDVPMNGYVRTIPSNYQVVNYQGTTCYLVNGTYYRPIFYQGSTVYVVVTPSAF